jgi:hypothetical protein
VYHDKKEILKKKSEEDNTVTEIAESIKKTYIIQIYVLVA